MHPKGALNMRRRDMRDLVKKMATKLDQMVSSGIYPAAEAAEIISLIRDLDAGFGSSPELRLYTKALAQGVIVLEKDQLVQ